MDFLTKSDIETSFSRIETLFECGIFSPENSRNPLVQSALSELLIRIRDLMAKSNRHGEPITFNEDINETDRIKNVADVIKFVRDAICHIDSDNHNHDECNARLSFNVAYGKCVLMEINGVKIGSDYTDDVAFFFGNQKLYLRSHLRRAYDEAKRNLQPVLERV